MVDEKTLTQSQPSSEQRKLFSQPGEDDSGEPQHDDGDSNLSNAKIVHSLCVIK